MTSILPHISSNMPSSSASGILSYLMENDENLKVFTLKRLYELVDIHWAEICDSLPLIEELCEDSSFPAADLAASLASKCFYHLQEYNDALRLAFSAGKYLDVSVKSEYIDTLLAKCIDEYKELRLQQESDSTVVIDERMENIIEKMFQRCYDDSCFEQAIGIALDTRRIDKVEEVCSKAISSGRENILDYTFNLCQGSARNIKSREFRLSVIAILVRLYAALRNPDYSNVCFGLQYLNRAADVAHTLDNLCRGSLPETLQAYQIAFDLQEAENQGFVLQIVEALEGLTVSSFSSSSSAEPDTAASSSSSSSHDSEEYVERVKKLKRILLEGFDVDLTLNFLFKQCNADINILKSIKAATEVRPVSILHNATVVAHSFMYNGTTLDIFLRENLEWLGRANNWAKFTGVASIGVVHKGHVHESMNLLQPYLPQAGQSASPYSEAGALYALGLIHANKGGKGDSTVISYLSDALRNSGTNDVVQHGACLGIGLAAMATGDANLFEAFRQVLFTDNAVAGEGAALSIGLLMVGQSDTALAEAEIPNLLNQAHDSPHEKIVRALSLSIAMMVYGKEEGADVIIEQLSRDRDPIIRYGGMYALAMAYCGTGDNGATRKLLHVAVSDVNDDVRRAAVTCIGFVCFRAPDTVPLLVSLLAESFNPHVRYGACMAVGIACAGLASKDAIDLLTPMLEDAADFVRQGALLSLSLVIQQASEARSPSVKRFRDHLMTVINDKHQTHMTKVGAILAAGIIDAGGRNVVVSLQSRAGFLKMGGAVGVMMFMQYWYWYPLMHFLTLAFAPTMLIGLNKDFDMPKEFTVTCNAPLSMFAYPKPEEKKGDEKKPVATAVLSTTARAKAREARKEAKKAGKSSVTIDITGSSSPGAVGGDEAPACAPSLDRVVSCMSTASYISVEENKTGGLEDGKSKKEKEPPFFSVSNPSRVIPSQTRFLSLAPATSVSSRGSASTAMDEAHIHTHEEEAMMQQRYRPVDIGRIARPTGIIMLIDQDPSRPEDVVRVERVLIGQEDEAPPPEPFEWNPNAED